MDSKEGHGSPRRVLKGSIIIYNDRQPPFHAPCVICHQPARAFASKSLTAPNTFVLLIELDGFEADCKVVIRHGQDLGVTFVSPPRMVKPKRVQIVKGTR